MNKQEIWKSIKEYEEIYEVSNLGRVRSLDRYINGARGLMQLRKGKILSRNYNSDGYMTVKLSKDGKSKRIGVHILVAMAFVDGYFDGAEVNHKNGIRDDNRPENLEWVTHADNVRHSISLGTHISLRDMSGEHNPNYGNRTLSKKYSENKELAKEKQGRTGERNGSSKPIRLMLPDNEIIEFSYIGQCADYLMKHCYTKNKSLDSVRDQISKAAKNKCPYVGCHFVFI